VRDDARSSRMVRPTSHNWTSNGERRDTSPTSTPGRPQETALRKNYTAVLIGRATSSALARSWLWSSGPMTPLSRSPDGRRRSRLVKLSVGLLPNPQKQCCESWDNAQRPGMDRSIRYPRALFARRVRKRLEPSLYIRPHAHGPISEQEPDRRADRSSSTFARSKIVDRVDASVRQYVEVATNIEIVNEQSVNLQIDIGL